MDSTSPPTRRVLSSGRYELGELIGQGGMSSVYHGFDTRLRRTVAIKILRSSLASDPAFRTRFRQEAQSASRMAHPTIVRVFDAGEDTETAADGSQTQIPFIVMEHVAGRNLKQVIAEEGPLPLEESARIIGRVLTALEYSHRAGVVHRDIKPGNIMITDSGQVKVMDFGIARAITDSSSTVAQTTQVLGTASYFSPEQAKGETVDARTDLYSAGVVLFEMLTGSAPFRGDTAVAVAYQHVSEPPPVPSTLNPDVSPAFDRVVANALRKDRRERYQSAADFRADVEVAASGRIPAASREPDLEETLFGPSDDRLSESELALRRLTEDSTVVRTQSRPPVIWIWAAILSVVVIIFAVVFWIFTLVPANIVPDSSRKIPDLTGVTQQNAVSTLTDLGLSYVVRQQNDPTVDPGQVISTDPEAGMSVQVGSTVTLFVSLGPELATVPTNIINVSPEAAASALQAAGFVVGTTTMAHSPTVGPNLVMTTSPAGGQQVPKGSTVDLVVSDGMVEIPDVVGQAVATATQMLQAGGVQVPVTEAANPGCRQQSGTPVVSQSAVGTQPQGTRVTITYCSG